MQRQSSCARAESRTSASGGHVVESQAISRARRRRPHRCAIALRPALAGDLRHESAASRKHKVAFAGVELLSLVLSYLLTPAGCRAVACSRTSAADEMDALNVLRRFPALSSLPGHSPAQERRWAGRRRSGSCRARSRPPARTPLTLLEAGDGLEQLLDLLTKGNIIILICSMIILIAFPARRRSVAVGHRSPGAASAETDDDWSSVPCSASASCSRLHLRLRVGPGSPCFLRVALAAAHGQQDRPAALTHHVPEDDVVELDVGVLEQLLDALDMLGPTRAPVACACASVSRSAGAVLAGTKLGLIKPHAIRSASHIASFLSVLRPGTFFKVRRIAQHQLEVPFEHMPHRLPVHAGGLHRHVLDAEGVEPVGQGQQAPRWSCRRCALPAPAGRRRRCARTPRPFACARPGPRNAGR